MKFLCPI